MEETVISFVAGLDTIGGNIISIQHGKYRIITDFGAQVGAPISSQIDETLTMDLLEADRLPRLDGVYSRASIQNLDSLEPYEDSTLETIICLSHLHIDHIGSLKHISSQIPIFALADAEPFYDLLEETGLLPDYELTIQGIEPEEVLEFGPFKVCFHENDHDTIGAASIFIECPDLRIVYSGDFRLTGFHPDRVVTWAQKARDWQADLFLIEGTSFSFGLTEPTHDQVALEALTEDWRLQTEKQAVKAFRQVFRDHPNQCIAYNGYAQNVERLVTFIQLANKAGRQVLLQSDMIQLIQPFISDIENIDVYNPSKLAEIQDHPGHYAIQVDNRDLSWLETNKKGIYLHSNGMPLGYYMPGYVRFVQSIVGAGWMFVQASISGHANKDDLLSTAYLVDAQITVPWHTYNRHGFGVALQDRGLQTWLPSLYQTYSAKEIKELAND